ncbi:MAG: restriction endonuclease [Clostridia bacterium]|nr:restriction endonuclease [Clostridia bacterium]
MAISIAKVVIIVIAIIFNVYSINDGCASFLFFIMEILYVIAVLNDNLDFNKYLFYPACFSIILSIAYRRLLFRLSSPYKGLFRRRDIKNVETELLRVDGMLGDEFEHYVAKLLLVSEIGFVNTKVTSQSGDYGADIIAKKLNGDKYAIQCKRYDKNVGVESVQEVGASLAYYGCSHGVVVTNSYYTKAAKILAKKNNIELWDRDKLISLISRIVARKRKTKTNNVDIDDIVS